MRTESRIPPFRIRKKFTSALVLVAGALLILCSGSISRSQDPVETIRIESELVDLKVSVLGLSPTMTAPLLEQKDFQVLEDGSPQEISFFAAADAPFDLVLLLDLSGSTQKKLKMIRRSAKRFVEAARAVDRIAVTAFTDQLFLLSDFSLNRERLKKDIDDIDDAFGGTNFWDALSYVMKDVVKQNQGSRRSAVVVMTDGVDNALPEVRGPGSAIAFEDLVAAVRSSEAIVFPIYLDTEKEDVKQYKIPPAAYALAREQMAQIAAASGTTMYRAAKLEDLEQLYAQVIRDLSTVYSIGYRPSNRTLDGKWRTVDVQLPGRPTLQARTKRGYFAKLSDKP
jgi:VWFA-related protein